MKEEAREYYHFLLTVCQDENIPLVTVYRQLRGRRVRISLLNYIISFPVQMPLILLLRLQKNGYAGCVSVSSMLTTLFYMYCL